ncbi:MAG: FAD-binding protein [Bradymonadaceae bacterium]|nr:FAD-binding protein [Lujinxingiaceae bacterium]
MKKTRVARSFYTKRSLPQPVIEHWPADARELRALITAPLAKGELPRVIVGDGQHLRPGLIGERKFDVIRTEKCQRIVSLDRLSGIVRVESGVRWRDLQEVVAERGFSLHRYNLYPSTATIGGLLARRQALPKHLFYGDLRDGCMALSAVSPATDRYRYIPAPRKASGPDLRHLYIGGEGLLGAILDATLVVLKPMPGRLYSFAVEDVAHATKLARQIFAQGVRPSWSHFEGATSTLSMAVHAPASLLYSLDKHLRTYIGADFTLAHQDELAARRQVLEDNHPDRRLASSASRTLAVAFDLTRLAAGIKALGALPAGLEIHNWSAHAALAYLTYESDAQMQAAIKTAVPGALDARPLIDGGAVSWPQWAQSLKTQLDAGRLLATGP